MTAATAQLDALDLEDCATCGKPASATVNGRHAVTREGTARTGYTYSTQCVECWNASVAEYHRQRAAEKAAAPKCEGCGKGQQSYVMNGGVDGCVKVCRGCKRRIDGRIHTSMLFGPPRASRAVMLAAARGQA